MVWLSFISFSFNHQTQIKHPKILQGANFKLVLRKPSQNIQFLWKSASQKLSFCSLSKGLHGLSLISYKSKMTNCIGLKMCILLTHTEVKHWKNLISKICEGGLHGLDDLTWNYHCISELIFSCIFLFFNLRDTNRTCNAMSSW